MFGIEFEFEFACLLCVIRGKKIKLQVFENIIWNTTKEMWWGIETKMQRSTNLYWISFELKRSSEFQYIVGIGCRLSTSIDEIFERWFRYGTWNVWLKRANKQGENVFIYSVCRCQHCKNLTQNYDENILFDNYSFIENQRKKKMTSETHLIEVMSEFLAKCILSYYAYNQTKYSRKESFSKLGGLQSEPKSMLLFLRATPLVSNLNRTHNSCNSILRDGRRI